MGSVLVLNHWAPSHQGNSLSCHCCHTGLYKDSTTENNEINRHDKLGNSSRHRHRHWWSLDQEPPMTAAARHQQRQRSLLVVQVHVVGGEATWAALTLMPVSTPVCPRTAVGESAAGRFLEESLRGLILAVTHRSL